MTAKIESARDKFRCWFWGHDYEWGSDEPKRECQRCGNVDKRFDLKLAPPGSEPTITFDPPATREDIERLESKIDELRDE